MSNYKKSAIVFDCDGTVLDYEKIDKEIIHEKLFKESKLLCWFDNLLWKINKTGLIPNTMKGLKLRFLVYGLFNSLFKPEYSNNLEYYKKEYRISAKEISKNSNGMFINLKENNKIFIISNNKYSDGLIFDGIKVTYVKSKKEFLKRLQEKYYISHFIGDNFFNDVVCANKLDIAAIFIGNSRIVKLLSSFMICVSNKKDIKMAIRSLK